MFIYIYTKYIRGFIYDLYDVISAIYWDWVCIL